MPAIEIHISAERLVHRYGCHAWAYAAEGAETSAAIGDWEQVGKWRSIGSAIRALERRAEPVVKRQSVLKTLLAFSPNLAAWIADFSNPAFS